MARVLVGVQRRRHLPRHRGRDARPDRRSRGGRVRPEARDGERKEPPADLKATVDELDALDAEPPEFFDLTSPWLYSPAST
ncbi:hypothetical protein [Kribbella kalugense]|uniref:hypothetical protein n=1 Tax=Kribbella kalugense TaxID=2512221 RepID=UPI00106612E4|nr:hypothetical protein [Kribbella kalugense]